MICQMANVSRKTFYALYHDKYEVIERIVVDNVISDLKGMLELLGKVELNQPIILEKMYQHFYDEKEFYVKAINIEGNNSLEHCLLYCFEDIKRYRNKFSRKGVCSLLFCCFTSYVNKEMVD